MFVHKCTQVKSGIYYMTKHVCPHTAIHVHNFLAQDYVTVIAYPPYSPVFRFLFVASPLGRDLLDIDSPQRQFYRLPRHLTTHDIHVSIKHKRSFS
ncbi:hypothetical protein NPIL_33681 [Nephila pilipes]|uniref:Uncharacterized protein n=1 Tax=Nephila pilipes TaxID=299642 RepID=A0A8X6TTP9_NEPPI|nr:hypothetical protein NPIL_33681 [Nephila pilipes]